MQILKGKEARMPEFNKYVSTNPHQTYTNMDQVMAMKNALNRQNTDFTEDGKSIQEQLDESKELILNKFLDSYAPEFARDSHPEATLLGLRGEGWLWDISWLRKKVRDASWSYFERDITRSLLEWYGWDGLEDWIKVEEAAIQKLKSMKNNLRS